MIAEQEQRPYRILIVDNLPHEREAIRTAIEDAVSPCECLDADSVESATELLRREALPFDLAVVDLRLADRAEGLSLVLVIKEILKRHSQTPVIVYTAHPTVPTACAAYEAGASAYLSKLDEDSTVKLQKKVKELLERRELRAGLRREFEVREQADQALEQHKQEWTAQYGDQFALVDVRGPRVVKVSKNPYDLWEAFEQYPEGDKGCMTIIEVPGPEVHDADR